MHTGVVCSVAGMSHGVSFKRNTTCAVSVPYPTRVDKYSMYECEIAQQSGPKLFIHTPPDWTKLGVLHQSYDEH